jgi:hypothetical protein
MRPRSRKRNECNAWLGYTQPAQRYRDRPPTLRCKTACDRSPRWFLPPADTCVRLSAQCGHGANSEIGQIPELTKPARPARLQSTMLEGDENRGRSYLVRVTDPPILHKGSRSPRACGSGSHFISLYICASLNIRMGGLAIPCAGTPRSSAGTNLGREFVLLFKALAALRRLALTVN